MKIRNVVVFTVLGLSIAGAKTYEINLDSDSKAGNATLKAGKYNVAVDASKVRFIDATSGKSTEADGKVVTADKKFTNTMVDSSQVNGVAEIREIDLGGTKTRIEFQP